MHFGLICPDLSGHLNPSMALARELSGRGHRVTFYQRLVSQKKVTDAGFDFRPFGVDEFPPERSREELRKLALLSGKPALDFTVQLLTRRTRAVLREVPGLARADGVEAIIVDQVCPEGITLGHELNLPAITICNALALHPDYSIPPFCFTWPYGSSPWRRARNWAAYRLIKHVSKPMLRVLNDHCRARNLPRYDGIINSGSPLLQISQQPPEFDYPRSAPPRQLHYVGPLVDASVRERTDFPFDKLDGRPLIYASMGTLQTGQDRIFGTIAQACEGLGVQLVISLGGGGKPESLPKLAGDPLVVEFAPQLQLLRKAALCITHAGLNTALECLSIGLPMVAIPITNDQPGVAARIAWTGSGLFVPLQRLNPEYLRAAIGRVRSERQFAENARKLQAAIARRGGACQAADLIEKAVRSGKPVLADSVGACA